MRSFLSYSVGVLSLIALIGCGATDPATSDSRQVVTSVPTASNLVTSPVATDTPLTFAAGVAQTISLPSKTLDSVTIDPNSCRGLSGASNIVWNFYSAQADADSLPDVTLTNPTSCSPSVAIAAGYVNSDTNFLQAKLTTTGSDGGQLVLTYRAPIYLVSKPQFLWPSSTTSIDLSKPLNYTLVGTSTGITCKAPDKNGDTPLLMKQDSTGSSAYFSTDSDGCSSTDVRHNREFTINGPDMTTAEGKAYNITVTMTCRVVDASSGATVFTGCPLVFPQLKATTPLPAPGSPAFVAWFSGAQSTTLSGNPIQINGSFKSTKESAKLIITETLTNVAGSSSADIATLLINVD